MNELEKEFKMLVNLNKANIDTKIESAKQLIAEAKEMADECGIPIEINIDEDVIYEPESFRSRYKFDVDNDEIKALLGFDPFVPFGDGEDWGDGSGWQSSMNC